MRVANGDSVQKIIVIVCVAVAYVALAGLSGALAYSEADAWTVWLASGLVLGLLLSRPRAAWLPILGGAFVGATVFAVMIGSTHDALGYGLIEVLAAASGAWIVTRVVGVPLVLDSPRDFAAMVFGGALPVAIIGALIATVWHVATGGVEGAATFRVWALSSFVGTLIVAPLVLAWAQFRPRRSGGLPMSAFAGGAIICAVYLLGMYLLFRAGPEQRLGGNVGRGLIYVPIVFMAWLALLWGLRGATLAAGVGTLIALFFTAAGKGPFAGIEGYFGAPELEVQAYAAALAFTGILVAVLAAKQREAVRAARAWQTRFEAAIGAHRLITYEWDPATGRLVVTGDETQLLGGAKGRVATLSDWLAIVAPEERERVAARFDARALGDGVGDSLLYFVTGVDGAKVAVTDEARAIIDHDGELHRVVGIVRVAGPGAR
jgi:integral membrane sensor domain MASE1